MGQKTRVDKWLWTVRIFKSRTLAADACKEGKVKIEGQPVKPSQMVQPGEVLLVKKNGFDLQFKILEILHTRVGAPQAQVCYEDLTPEEELNKYKEWYIGKGAPERRDKGAGRPTKKERRSIDGFKTGWE